MKRSGNKISAQELAHLHFAVTFDAAGANSEWPGWHFFHVKALRTNDDETETEIGSIQLWRSYGINTRDDLDAFDFCGGAEDMFHQLCSEKARERLKLDNSLFDDVAYISEMEVDPAFRRQGVGTALLKFVEENLCHYADLIGLSAVGTTTPRNLYAFYRANRFVRIGRSCIFFKDITGE